MVGDLSRMPLMRQLRDAGARDFLIAGVLWKQARIDIFHVFFSLEQVSEICSLAAQGNDDKGTQGRSIISLLRSRVF